MRGLEQRDIALRIGWREPGLIKKPQGRDHDLPRYRKLIGIIADPEIETVDDAAVVAFVDEHDRSGILANSLCCHHCGVQDGNGALAGYAIVEADRPLQAKIALRSRHIDELAAGQSAVRNYDRAPFDRQQTNRPPISFGDLAGNTG